MIQGTKQGDFVEWTSKAQGSSWDDAFSSGFSSAKFGAALGVLSGAAKGYLEVRAKTVASADNATKPQVVPTDKKDTVLSAPVNGDNTMFPNSTIDEGVKITMKQKENHIFDGKKHPKPYMKGVVEGAGGREAVVKATLQSINGRLPASGQFKDISYQLNGLNLFARGNVVNGVPIINSIHDGKVYK